MAISPQEIDRVVRAVLSGFAQRAAPAEAPEPKPSRQQISPRVVGLEWLRDHLGSSRVLEIAPSTVVTPAARDELRAQGVELRFMPPHTVSKDTETTHKIYLVNAARNWHAEPLLRQVRRAGIDMQILPERDLVQAIPALAERVRRETSLAVVATEHVAAAVCLANRREALRAASVSQRTDVTAGLEQMGMNVLVANPATLTPFELTTCVHQFYQGHATRAEPMYARHLEQPAEASS